MIYDRQEGVPLFECHEFALKSRNYCLLIPIINEGNRIQKELERGYKYGVAEWCDIIICDGNSTDGSTEINQLKKWNVNTLLIKKDIGKQGAQLRMGIWWALQRGYRGIITIDGNNKDSIETVPSFVHKLEEGYDFVQGSRFIKGGKEVNTPLVRLLSVKLIHAPIISFTAKYRFTDTTNAFRGYSSKYLKDERVKPLRDIFMTYELLAYLSVRATQLGYRACEIPVLRAYPKKGKTPTKISFLKGNYELMSILLKNLLGKYNP